MGELNEIWIVGSIYIIEGVRTCWKCNKETPIIGLGISNFIHLIRNDDEHIICTQEISNDLPIIHLAWVDNENEIPKNLLRYLKMHYPVHNGNSNTVGECFANHCKFCNSIQGNYYIFSECDSPLSIDSSDELEIIKKLSTLNIKRIACNANICVNWNIQFSTSDRFYSKYCILSNAYIWDYGLDCLYHEMYGIETKTTSKPIHELSTTEKIEDNHRTNETTENNKSSILKNILSFLKLNK